MRLSCLICVYRKKGKKKGKKKGGGWGWGGHGGGGGGGYGKISFHLGVKSKK